MAPNRRKSYKEYLDASAKGTASPPCYQTLRRWRLQGKLNEENLQEQGISIRWRTSLPRTKPTCANIPVQETCPQTASEDTTVETSSTLNDVWSESSVLGRTSSVTHSENDLNSSQISSVSGRTFSDGNSSLSEDGSDEDTRNISSVLKSKLIGTDALNECLHPNLSVTKFETLIMIMHLALKHGMSDVVIEDLISFVNQLIGVPNSLRESKYLFHKLFMFGSKATIHFYCPNCSVYLGREISFSDGVVECLSCDWSGSVTSHNDGNYFLSLKVRDQLTEVLSKPNLKFVSTSRTERVITDIMDGQIYKMLQREGGPYSNPDLLTLTFNTDGSPVFSSGPNSLWPVHFFINEIDPSQRYTADNILLGGLWFGKTEANLQVFLKPFVEELQELQQSGVVWRKPDGTAVESPVYAICCCTDSVAKPKVQHLHQFNGSYGCGYCLHPNSSITVFEKVDDARLAFDVTGGKAGDVGSGPQVAYNRKKVMRYTWGDYPMRTNKELREHMKLAAASHLHSHVMGATGVSVLCELKYFNVVHGFVIDYLHNVLLGTVKRLAGLWFDSTNHGSPYYIGLSIGQIDDKINGITLPKGFRPPRPMSDRCHWKAHEWRAFLLYYGLPVLSNVLPLPYYNHFKMLVNAIYTLTKEAILHDEINEAHELLNDFVCQYQDLYGETNMVYNVHLTTHLASMVAKAGPLWSWSAFPFETANGRLVSLALGTKGVATQVARKYIMTKSIPKLLRSNYKVADDVLDFCTRMIGFKYLKHSMKGDADETLLGRQYYYSLDNLQKKAFIDRNLESPHSVSIVNRAVVDGKIYHGRLTTRQKKACDSCVRLTSGEFALIDLILSQPCENNSKSSVSFLVTKLNMAMNPSLMVPHIKQCSIDTFGEQRLIKSDEISRKCIFYVCTGRYFVAEISNFYETD